MSDKFKVKVVRIDDHQPGDQGFTLGKVYEVWNKNAHDDVDVIDDRGLKSALFQGEWERVSADQSS
jgi:hypothetical protein